MESFDHLFASHFTDVNRTLTDSLGGFVDHAVRFAGVLPARAPFTALFTEANTATQALSGRAQQAQQALGLSLGTQKQATTETTTAQTTALDRIRSNEAALRSDVLIEDPRERQRLYALLYPTGTLAYYTQAPLGTALPDRLDEYLTRTETEATALGTAFVERTRAALGPFRQVRETQVTALAGTDTARDTRAELVAALNEQCDYNYHLLSLLYRIELGRAATCWNASYYVRAAPAVPAGQLRQFAITAQHHRLLFDLTRFASATGLTLTLPAGGPFYLGRGATATAGRPAQLLEIQAQAAPQTVPLHLVPGTDTFLIGYNEGGTAVHLDAVLG